MYEKIKDTIRQAGESLRMHSISGHGNHYLIYQQLDDNVQPGKLAVSIIRKHNNLCLNHLIFFWNRTYYNVPMHILGFLSSFWQHTIACILKLLINTVKAYINQGMSMLPSILQTSSPLIQKDQHEGC